jgi:hypothetical protein
MVIGLLAYPGKCHYWTGDRLLNLERPMYFKTLYTLYVNGVVDEVDIWRTWVEDDRNCWR